MNSLHNIGKETVHSFNKLAKELSQTTSRFRDQLSASRFALQSERFTLWASTLGLFQVGHVSLDYRLRDADIVSRYVADVLLELNGYLSDITDIITHVRPPAEDGAALAPAFTEDGNATASRRQSSEVGDDTQAEDELAQTNSDSDDSEGSFHEVSFKFEAIIERLNGLYNLATKIRNPTTRPQRSTADLFKRNPRQLEEREMIETSVVKHMHSQYLMRTFMSLIGESGFGISAEGSNTWLVERIGKANARRSQQFVYWKEHAERLAATPSKPEPPVHLVPVPVAVDIEAPLAATAVPTATPQGTQHYTEGPTTATRLDPDQVKLDDEVSMRSSFASRVSTANAPGVDKLNWPLPPKSLEKDGFFSCPYCKTICPARYLKEDSWKKHVVNDLQPYQCTYQDCIEPERIYGSKPEWIKHEGMSHARVWHCAEHPEEEFWMRSEYIDHLRNDLHSADTTALEAPELVAACIGPSNFVQRPCPVCEVEIKDLSIFQSHLAFHLERFALLALPKLTDFAEDEDGEFHDSSQSLSAQAQVQKRFDDDSRVGDFEWDEVVKFEDEPPGVAQPKLPANSNEVLKEIIDLFDPTPFDGISMRVGSARVITPRKAPDVEVLLQKFRLAELLQARDTCQSIAAMTEVRMNHYRSAEDRLSLPSMNWLDPTGHVNFSTAMSGKLPSKMSKEELDARLERWLFLTAEAERLYQITSYWSVPEQQKFPDLIAYFGRDFTAIAEFMKTKSPTMIKNFYTRDLNSGKKELEDAAKRAEGMRERGEPIGPPPTPIAPPKRRYEAAPSMPSLPRPTAPPG